MNRWLLIALGVVASLAVVLLVPAWLMVLCIANHPRALRALEAVDQVGNALSGGDPDMTISWRAAIARDQGKRWGCVLCRWLDRLDPDHCDKSIGH